MQTRFIRRRVADCKKIKQASYVWPWLLIVLILAGAAAPLKITKDEIVLPEILAIELPSTKMTAIGPTEAPLLQLLQLGTAGAVKITHDRVSPLSVGGTLITWTAWTGEPAEKNVRATKSAYVYVLPHGQTPIGVSSNDHATAGNQAAKVVRDSSGKVHAAWLDAGRPGRGSRVLYRRGVQDSATGTVTWETESISVSESRFESSGSYVAIAASNNAIHFVWTPEDSTRYRRLVLSDGDWKFEPIRNTRASGHSYENSGNIAVRGDNEIHLITPSGAYAISKNGGLAWKVEQVPPVSGMRLKNPALAVDSAGNAHVAFTGLVRSAPDWSSSKPNHGYWELRYVRRDAAGAWVDAQNVLAAFSQWSDSTSNWDILADWPAIAVDKKNNIHLVWHGTVNTHIFGNDEAFYAYRPATADGKWSNWNQPQSLHPMNRAKGEYHSFAPSLAVSDTGDLAVAVVFYDTTDGERLLDYDARIIRNGTLDATPVLLSRLARDTAAGGNQKEALSSWFPVAGPILFRHPNGGLWLDVLTTVAVPEHHKSPHLIVYQGIELTNYLRKTPGYR